MARLVAAGVRRVHRGQQAELAQRIMAELGVGSGNRGGHLAERERGGCSRASNAWRLARADRRRDPPPAP